ncbi:MAG: hypothetical protein MJ099_05930, partial [Clostridia bacterium]|nr:hypothetical protein [Clostridia bacterium]
NGLDKVEALTKYTKEIAQNSSIERMYGSMPADKKQFIQDMINDLPIPASTVSTEATIDNDTSDAPVFSPETLSKAPSELLDSINALSACKGFVELFSVWKQNGLDKVEALTKYTKEIAHQASIERMFGSMPADAARRKQFIQDMINELQTKA